MAPITSASAPPNPITIQVAERFGDPDPNAHQWDKSVVDLPQVPFRHAAVGGRALNRHIAGEKPIHGFGPRHRLAQSKL
jgi:hypothetical protein